MGGWKCASTRIHRYKDKYKPVEVEVEMRSRRGKGREERLTGQGRPATRTPAVSATLYPGFMRVNLKLIP